MGVDNDWEEVWYDRGAGKGNGASWDIPKFGDLMTIHSSQKGLWTMEMATCKLIKAVVCVCTKWSPTLKKHNPNYITLHLEPFLPSGDTHTYIQCSLLYCYTYTHAIFTLLSGILKLNYSFNP